MCRICWSADEVADVGVTGKTVGFGVILVRINVVVKIRPNLKHQHLPVFAEQLV